MYDFNKLKDKIEKDIKRLEERKEFVQHKIYVAQNEKTVKKYETEIRVLYIDIEKLNNILYTMRGY